MRVRFHLPDFSGNFKLNFLFAETLKHRPEFFREGVEIASFYGVFRRLSGTAAELREELSIKRS